MTPARASPALLLPRQVIVTRSSNRSRSHEAAELYDEI
jgi:hypothetical protein